MEQPVIQIQQGKLLGTVSKDMDGNPFYSFRGIPYARPPLGKLRFKAPLPPVPWKGIFSATQNGDCCFSVDVFEKVFVGSEDCLNLNVYTPHLPRSGTNLLPVMVWIHGGGFVCGSNNSEIYGPEFLITEKVVIVSINYRLGLLGFLSLNDPSAGVPGNTGFKDIVMALKWVRQNIEQFNGDSKNVTIFGASSGGATVHLLTLSPMAQGLFHKAIAQSGSALNPWSRARKADEEVYAAFGCEGKSDLEFLEHLQSLSVKEILQNQYKLEYVIEPDAILVFGLIIERPIEKQGEAPFMCEDPLNIILSGNFDQVPFIMGATNLEGLVINTYQAKRSSNTINDPESNLPHFLGYKRGTPESQTVALKIQEFYFGNEKPGEDTQDKIYEMVTDNSFFYGIYAAARLHIATSRSRIYFYRMSIKTSLEFLQAIMEKDREKGAAHYDDVAYMFKTIFTPPLSPDSVEYKFIKIFVKLWTNFAYYGNPTHNVSSIVWKEATKERIGSTEFIPQVSFTLYTQTAKRVSCID
ncbi:juvenile hormone esterase-like [Zophobas morio]|uniref:juvenile hormone esterase-like n=1 Tax=Zophobas morio TaxID=2755281 RepID=UPI003083394A